MPRTLRGYIAKCNEKVSKEIFEYEQSQGFKLNHKQEYGVLFLYRNLTKPFYFRYDNSAMITINFSKINWLIEDTSITVEDDLEFVEKTFDSYSNIFFRIDAANTLTHVRFGDFKEESDLPFPESSSIHTKNYIHI